jgi:hypothetical protein
VSDDWEPQTKSRAGLDRAGSLTDLPASPYRSPKQDAWKYLLLSLIMVAAVVAVYYPVHSYPFLLGIDDGAYVYDNVHVTGPLNWESFQWAFTHAFVLNYDPVTFLAHSINVRLFGLNAGGHHDVNLLLHVINALLLFWVLRRSTGCTARSFMVAALFAVHPINVENVAWIAELKTLLSTTFFFLALGVYICYVRKPEPWRMTVVSVLYVLGLLAKPQVITLPFVLLLWDYWPLGRMSGQADANADRVSPARKLWLLVNEKGSLFALALADALLTIKVATKPLLERYTFAIRIGTAIRSYAIYLGKAFWPANLAFDYRHPGYSLRWGPVWAALLLLAAITAWVVAQKRHRYLLVGWFWFLGTMIPMINLVRIDRAPPADRYAYLCFVGLFVMLCWGLADLASELNFPRFALPALSALVLIGLSLATHRQVRYWSDATTVWTRSVEVNHSWSAEHNLGMIMVQRGQVDEGLAHIYRALETKPRDLILVRTTAEIEQQRGNFGQAIKLYQEALELSNDDQTNAQIWANMGHAYSDLGDTTKALECYRAAQRLKAAPSGAQR